MPTLLVSSKGQIVLPAEVRRRLGMGAGARLEVLEEADGLKLRVVRPVASADLGAMAAARQRPAAVAALSERSFVPITVVLELKWVLRGFYELPGREVSRVLRALSSIEHVTIEDRDAVLSALSAVDKGVEFADALHALRSTRTSAFATFDRRLAKRAKGLALVPPVELLT